MHSMQVREVETDLHKLDVAVFVRQLLERHLQALRDVATGIKPKPA